MRPSVVIVLKAGCWSLRCNVRRVGGSSAGPEGFELIAEEAIPELVTLGFEHK